MTKVDKNMLQVEVLGWAAITNGEVTGEGEKVKCRIEDGAAHFEIRADGYYELNVFQVGKSVTAYHNDGVIYHVDLRPEESYHFYWQNTDISTGGRLPLLAGDTIRVENCQEVRLLEIPQVTEMPDFFNVSFPKEKVTIKAGETFEVQENQRVCGIMATHKALTSGDLLIDGVAFEFELGVKGIGYVNPLGNESKNYKCVNGQFEIEYIIT